MRTSLLFSLAVAIIFAAVGWGSGQGGKPPDFTGKSLTKWIEILKDAAQRRDDDKLEEAQRALGPGGPYAKTAIPALIDALDLDDFTIRGPVADTLADYGWAAVEPLIRAMKSSKTNIRNGAAEALGYVRPHAPQRNAFG